MVIATYALKLALHLIIGEHFILLEDEVEPTVKKKKAKLVLRHSRINVIMDGSILSSIVSLSKSFYLNILNN